MIKQKVFLLEIDGETSKVCDTIDIAAELVQKWIRDEGFYPENSFPNLCDYYDREKGFYCEEVFCCTPCEYYK